MLQNGLVNEVKKLLYKNVDVKSTSMQGLGYKEIAEYIQGKLSYNDAVEVIKRDTRRYAKRQLTWFRKDNRVNWIEIGNNSNIVFLAKEIKKLLEG
jgi:tRNA dimethylallyltransferase